MCERGDVEILCIGGHLVDVDRCIAPIIVALNAAGLPTRASCCGHGRQPGRISLRDGREIFIAASYNQAQAISAVFPPLS